MINNTKGEYRNHCPLTDAGFACSTGGGFGAGAAALARGDCYRRAILCGNEGTWGLWVMGGQRRMRGVEIEEA